MCCAAGVLGQADEKRKGRSVLVRDHAANTHTHTHTHTHTLQSTLIFHSIFCLLGKGEHGKPYPLAEDECDDSVYKENGFNIYVSNNIALDRSLPDIRHPNCKTKLYLESLPNTSIIIPFHNEGWSSLLRTIHSISYRTPDHLIAEIILVDDYSDREHLKGRLEEYMARFPKVRIVRTKKREGLIRTRLLGASVAKGEVLTFLDSHCEANVNWLPPLLGVLFFTYQHSMLLQH
eukprot:XP_014064804.1 PREDICTED: polypeptide N-acetylgalactosaminyltransferase-like 6 [Salmo salar]